METLLQRRHQSLSAPVWSARGTMQHVHRVPELSHDEDRRVLASLERRHATAKLRQDWMTTREGSPQPDLTSSRWPTVDMRRLIEFKKRLRCVQSSSQRSPGSKSLISPVTNEKLAAEVSKRDVIDRPSFTLPIHMGESTKPPPHFGHPDHRSAMFLRAPSCSTRKRAAERRIHFIDREWSSECVSWQHFRNNTTEFQRRSWLE